MLKQLSNAVKFVLSHVPGPMPVSTAQFEKWSASILSLCGNYADQDSMKFALASMVLHANADAGFLSKRYFVVRLRKAASNQVASQVFQDIKAKQQAAQQAAAQSQQAEVTAAETTTSGQTPGQLPEAKENLV